MNLAELFQKIQDLKSLANPTELQTEELLFYQNLFDELAKSFLSGGISTAISIDSFCDVEEIKAWAEPLGFTVIPGSFESFGRIYLLFSKNSK